MIDAEILKRIRVAPGTNVKLSEFDTTWAQTRRLKELGKEFVKERAEEILAKSREELAESQNVLYADNRFAVLVVLQAMDAAGKDGVIQHVMSGINPQGCQVYSFKVPSVEEREHDFLWRYANCLPVRGNIGIFNRSYYEDVLVVRVHPELLTLSGIDAKPSKAFWKTRFDSINNFERHLTSNKTIVLKFFLHISKEEQKKRFLKRLERPEKNWKFSVGDLAERAHWQDYVEAYEETLSATSTEWAPWHVVPADQKWATRAVVADVLNTSLAKLDLRYPPLDDAQRKALDDSRKALEME